MTYSNEFDDHCILVPLHDSRVDPFTVWIEENGYTWTELLRALVPDSLLSSLRLLYSKIRVKDTSQVVSKNFDSTRLSVQGT